MKFFKGYDLGIVIPTALLLGISLVILSSIDIGLFKNQALFVLVGVILFIFFSTIHISSFEKLYVLIYICALVLFASLFFIGIEVRGVRRWIDFLQFRVQFSELLKPFLIVAFASFLTRFRTNITFTRLLLIIGLFIPIVFFLLDQPDLGNAMIYGITFVVMLFTGGMSVWYAGTALILFVISIPVIWHFLADYQKNRIFTFLDPKHDPLGIGYNAIQSAIAVGSGLLFGRGLGRGVQSQLQFLPERHTDFIFATFSEEFGFIGSFVVLLLYFLLLLKMIKIAQNAPRSYESYIVIGIFAIFLSQSFINIGMNIGLIPITGVTLPLFSYGGSSLITSLVMLGIVNGVSRNLKGKDDILEIR